MNSTLGDFMQGKNSKHINGLYSFFDFDRFQVFFGRIEPAFRIACESKVGSFESASAPNLSLE